MPDPHLPRLHRRRSRHTTRPHRHGSASRREGGDRVSLLEAQLDAVETSMPFGVHGKVTGVNGLTIEATDLTLPLGSLCRIHSFGGKTSTAEVIGFRHQHTVMMPLQNVAGVSRGDRV